MTILRLPERGRPTGVPYRQCALGVDLPAEFVSDLKSLDAHLWPIFHPYKLLWDDFVNCYVGKLDDPRYDIVENSGRYGQMVLGLVLTDGKAMPVPDGQWHVWRWCEPAASWAHVVNIESRDPQYLQLLVRRLYLADQWNMRYGHKGYRRKLEEAQAEDRQRMQDERQDLMNEIHKANSGMMRRVIDNYERGNVNPHRPQKEIIVSGAGGKRSKIVRPLTDREGGLILPPGIGEE